MIVIEYDTYETGTLLTEEELNLRGQSGWRLGGIIQTQKSEAPFGLGSKTILRFMFHYHFWREGVQNPLPARPQP